MKRQRELLLDHADMLRNTQLSLAINNLIYALRWQRQFPECSVEEKFGSTIETLQNVVTSLGLTIAAIEEAADRLPEKPVFIPWPGAQSAGYALPRNLYPFSQVEVRYRNGTEKTGYLREFTWYYLDSPYDIVAYRVIEDKQP